MTSGLCSTHAQREFCLRTRWRAEQCRSSSATFCRSVQYVHLTPHSKMFGGFGGLKDIGSKLTSTVEQTVESKKSELERIGVEKKQAAAALLEEQSKKTGDLLWQTKSELESAVIGTATSAATAAATSAATATKTAKQQAVDAFDATMADAEKAVDSTIKTASTTIDSKIDEAGKALDETRHGVQKAVQDTTKVASEKVSETTGAASKKASGLFNF
ncbi:uncharacterized protein LOC126092286 [Schistocerca cancellata]|uniref:uncharacterized protein LOC126092286 n=1 Tax=Schistocerca cancellata TaxID=274614 RepID=UPI002118A717|nr:uncharacterized protein LOC126092286 [Schistocerca cancellata]